MTLIVLRCAKCAKETDSEHCRDGVCESCVARAAVSMELAEYSRLWAKRRRYAHAGGRQNNEQLGRIEKRIWLKLRPFGRRAPELMDQFIHDARTYAENVGGRIFVPQTGDFLSKRWPDGVRTLS